MQVNSHLVQPCLILILIGGLGLSFPAPAATSRDPSHDFFATNTIPLIRIEISGTNLANLRKDTRKYVQATVTENGVVAERGLRHFELRIDDKLKKKVLVPTGC